MGLASVTSCCDHVLLMATGDGQEQSKSCGQINTNGTEEYTLPQGGRVPRGVAQGAGGGGLGLGDN